MHLQQFKIYASQQGPSTARGQKFYVTQRFFSRDLFRFWDTPGSGDWVGRVRLVLRTFPELVWMSVQNLVEIGLAVHK